MRLAFKSLSVAIPTKDRPLDLDVTIESVFNQTVVPQQLIIIDQSKDLESQRRATARYEALRPGPGNSIKFVYHRDPLIPGLTAARNRALELVDAEILLFLDDDVILEPDFNEQILAIHRDHPEASGISGIISNYRPLPGAFRCWSRVFMRGPFRDDRQPVYWQASKLGESEPIRVTRLGGGLMSFSIAAIRDAKFDENLRGACDGEDVEFCARLWPGPLFIAPKARLVHRQSPTGRKAEHWLPKHARTNWYLYRRNWDRGVHNRLCFLWLNLGYIVAALGTSVRTRSLSVLRLLSRAFCDPREGNRHIESVALKDPFSMPTGHTSPSDAVVSMKDIRDIRKECQ